MDAMPIALVCKKCGSSVEVSIRKAEPTEGREGPVCSNCGTRLRISSLRKKAKKG